MGGIIWYSGRVSSLIGQQLGNVEMGNDKSS